MIIESSQRKIEVPGSPRSPGSRGGSSTKEVQEVLEVLEVQEKSKKVANPPSAPHYGAAPGWVGVPHNGGQNKNGAIILAIFQILNI